MNTKTLSPAYGRDYTSAKAVKADWNANKDFVIQDFFDKYDGKPINKEQADQHYGAVMIYYNAMQKFTVIKNK